MQAFFPVSMIPHTVHKEKFYFSIKLLNDIS